MAATYADKECPPGWEDLADEVRGTAAAAKQLADMGANIWQVALEDDAGLCTRLSDNEDYTFQITKTILLYCAAPTQAKAFVSWRNPFSLCWTKKEFPCKLPSTCTATP